MTRFFWRNTGDGMTRDGLVHEMKTWRNGPEDETLCGMHIEARRMNEPYSMRDGATEHVTCDQCRIIGGPQC
jgi:hypothetical protein